ncbi:MAG: hypothetical protein HQ562_04090 [Candidatus Marinimicrobia bacterium]|nr:hypothetical protein [Candidatus Neomarinimicrobiota bacterium]
MIRRRTPALIAILLFATLSGQLYFSGSSNLRYGESKTGQLYSESILNGNALLGNFNSWFQLEFSNPPELGRTVNGLQKFRLEYNTANSVFKFGDIYEIWGRGLVLNQYEDQLVDFDNSLTGISIRNQWNESLDWSIISGYRERHRLFGADANYTLKSLSVGISYLQSREQHLFEKFVPSTGYVLDSLMVTHRVKDLRTEYFADWYDIYVEYADKRTYDFNTDSIRSFYNGGGQGFYSNLNIYIGAWALSMDYKKYSFNISEPDPFSVADNYSGIFSFQRPPTVIREHTSRLLNRITHQVNFDDEVGYQIELSGPVLSDIMVLANYSKTSRNDVWNKIEVPNDTTNIYFHWEWQSVESTGLLPLTETYSVPFEELYLEVEGFSFNDRLHYRIGAARTIEVIDIFDHRITDTTRNIMYEEAGAITFPTALDWNINKRWNFEVKYEYQEFKKYKRIINTQTGIDTKESLFATPVQYNAFLSLGVSHSPGWSCALLIDASSRLEFGTTPQLDNINTLEKIVSNFIDLENRWIALELRWNITNSHTLTLTYGSQQGGILCSNGVCREIEAFEDGFKFTLTSLF